MDILIRIGKPDLLLDIWINDIFCKVSILLILILHFRFANLSNLPTSSLLFFVGAAVTKTGLKSFLNIVIKLLRIFLLLSLGILLRCFKCFLQITICTWFSHNNAVLVQFLLLLLLVLAVLQPLWTLWASERILALILGIGICSIWGDTFIFWMCTGCCLPSIFGSHFFFLVVQIVFDDAATLANGSTHLKFFNLWFAHLLIIVLLLICSFIHFRCTWRDLILRILCLLIRMTHYAWELQWCYSSSSLFRWIYVFQKFRSKFLEYYFTKIALVVIIFLTQFMPSIKMHSFRLFQVVFSVFNCVL